MVFDRYYHQFLYDIYGSLSVPLSRFLPQPWQMIYLETELSTVQTRLGTADQAVDEQYYTTVIDLYDSCATDGWLPFRAELPIETLHKQIFETVRCEVDRDRIVSRQR